MTPQEILRFNENERVWERYERRRARRQAPWRTGKVNDGLSEEALDELDWLCAERESRTVRAVGCRQ